MGQSLETRQTQRPETNHHLDPTRLDDVPPDNIKSRKVAQSRQVLGTKDEIQ
jgi:hypothetical protein